MFLIQVNRLQPITHDISFSRIIQILMVGMSKSDAKSPGEW